MGYWARGQPVGIGEGNMRTFAMAVFLGAAAWLVALAPAAMAQSPGLYGGRDCKTLLTCNFRANGAVRGCLSSYSCRVCKLMPAPCQVTGGERRCHAMRCSWG